MHLISLAVGDVCMWVLRRCFVAGSDDDDDGCVWVPAGAAGDGHEHDPGPRSGGIQRHQGGEVLQSTVNRATSCLSSSRQEGGSAPLGSSPSTRSLLGALEGETAQVRVGRPR